MRCMLIFIFLGLSHSASADPVESESESITPLNKASQRGSDIFGRESVWSNPIPQQVIEMRYAEANQLLNSEKWPEAITAFRSFLKDYPGHLPAHLGLAKALLQNKQREEALSIMRAALRMGHKDKELIEKRAETMAKLFLSKESYSTYQFGLRYLVAGNFRDARSRFKAALEGEDSNLEILLRLSQTSLLLGDSAEAIQRLEFAKSMIPWSPDVALWLGRSYYQSGSFDKAVENLKFAADQSKNLELASTWLAESLWFLGKKNESIKLLETDVEKNPLHLKSLLTLSRFYLEYKNKDQKLFWTSKRYLQVALSRYPEYQDRSGLEMYGELSDFMYQPKKIKSEIDSLLKEVEVHLDPTGTKSL